MAIVAYAIKLLIAGLFLHAGFSKLQPHNQAYYRGVIRAYGVVPPGLIAALPRIMGGIEMLTAVAILLPFYSSTGLIATTGLLTLYLLMFVKQLLQGRADIDCGCAGPGADVKISPALLLRNIILIGLCVFAINAATATFLSIWFLALPLAMMFGLIYVSCEQLMVNQQKIKLLWNT